MAVRSFPGLPLTGGYAPGQDGWSDAMNNNLRLLSGVTQLAVLDRVAALPGVPVDGDIYLLTATADVNKIAVRDEGAWVLFTPREGWLCYVADEDVFYTYNGAAWGLLTSLVTVTAAQISDASANGRSLITAADYAAMKMLLGYVSIAGDTMTGALIGTTFQAGADPTTVAMGARLVSSGAVQLRGTGSSGSFFRTANGATSGPGFVFWRALGASVGAEAQVVTGSYTGGFFAGGYSDAGAFGNLTAAFAFVAAENFTASAQSQDMLIALAPPGAITRPEAFRFKGSGDLQMGGANTVIDSTRRFVAIAGLVGTPSIYATGDANTGIWFPGADIVAISTAGVEGFRVTASGNLQAPLIHNNATAPTGTTGYIASGTYTPTLTNVANLAASTAYVCQWMRVGNVVTVSGKVDVDPTLTLTLTQLGISLPLASAITAQEQCAGSAYASGIAAQGAAIRGDAANDRAEMAWISGDTTNQPMYFSFTYQTL